MTWIELRISLHSTHERCKPAVRAYVDLSPDVERETELEVPLRRVGQATWSGHFAVDRSRSPCFLYRLGLVAQPGVDWSLSIRDRRAGHDLLVDGDALATAKCWLIGSCSLPTALRPT